MIDTKYIEEILKPLFEVINSKVQRIQEYLLDNMLPVEQFEKGLKHRPGIYVFFIKPKEGSSVEDFEKLWNSESKTIINFPKIIKSRYGNSMADSKDFYPFYIGKSEKVQSRIGEHINHSALKKTYGLKLLIRKSLLEKYNFLYSFYELREAEFLDKAIVQFIITRLEQTLREELKPWVGKQ